MPLNTRGKYRKVREKHIHVIQSKPKRGNQGIWRLVNK